MPRSLTATLRAALHDRETAEVFVHLLEMSHPSLSDPIRVCDHTTDVVSGAMTYTAFPFEITLAADQDDTAPRGRLKVCGVDQTITQAARQLSGPQMVVRLRLVRIDAPEITEIGPVDFTLANVSYDAGTVEGELIFDDFLSEPYPAESVTPANFPALRTVI